MVDTHGSYRLHLLRLVLMAIGRRNSSSNTSPGGTRITSVVFNDLNRPKC